MSNKSIRAISIMQNICDFYFKTLLLIAAISAAVLPWSALFYFIWLKF